MQSPHACAPAHLCAALDRCADSMEQAQLFLVAYFNRPPLEAIRLACKAGYGSWLEPGPGQNRPATHLFEVTLFDLSATAETAEQAASNWATIALRSLQAEVAA